MDLTARAGWPILAGMGSTRSAKILAMALLVAPMARPLAAQSAVWIETDAALRADTKLANGMMAKAGMATAWYAYGDPNTQPVIASFTLAADFSLPSGAKLRAGSAVGFWQKGEIRFLTLGQDWSSSEGILMAGGTKVSLFEGGSWEGFTPKNDLELGAGMPKAKAMKSLGFFANGNIHDIVLAADFPLPSGGLVCEAGSYLAFYENGSLSMATFTGVYATSGGMKFKPHSPISFFEKGIMRGTLAEPFDMGKGLVVKDEVEFSENGKISKAYLAKDLPIKVDDAHTAIMAANGWTVFNEDGSIGIGTLAKPYGAIPSGATVFDSDLKKAFDPGYQYKDPGERANEDDDEDLLDYM
jgi:hypothetical protein